ncbi:MAG: putative ABC transporter permease [Lachnobacterium sp.]|nr:putative ABC transporter permease [Lachnobacterium sp.]
MIVARFFVWFLIFSFMGWIYESIYCTVKSHKWENRGFLFGPVCPIYGIGGIVCSLLFSGIYLKNMTNLEIFIYSCIGSAILEYTTSWVLEKVFHAVWWDYSEIPLNINGRICLPATFGFGFGGLLVIHYIFPFVDRITSNIDEISMTAMAIIGAGVISADTAVTISAITGLTQNVQTIEENVNLQMEALYATIEGSIKDSIKGTIEGTKNKVAQTTDVLSSTMKVLPHTVKELPSTMKDFSGNMYASFAEKLHRNTSDENYLEEMKKEEKSRREEYTNIAMKNVAKFLNKSQKHVLHSVKKFTNTSKTHRAAQQLKLIERELKREKNKK